MKKKKKGVNCIKKTFSQMFTVCADFLALSPKMARFFIPLLVVILGLTSGTYVYAKYYSLSAKEGIAIATGVYFTANYAHDAGGEFVENLVNIGYSGGDTSFTFEVRNFENNLLFNTDNVNIPYTVELWLESTPDGGAKYYVNAGENESDTKQELGVGEAGKVTLFEQVISGGLARTNSYYISISGAPNDHVAVPIYVRVKTLEGSLINRTLTGKMLLSGSAKTESKIESQGFVIPEEPADISQFERLNSLSVFTYEVLTVGSAASGGTTEELRISWDPDILSIDLFDEAYLKWVETEKEANPNATITGPATDPETGWKYIVIDIMPYAAENINFFRGPEYEETFGTEESDETKLERLHEFINAKKIVTTS